MEAFDIFIAYIEWADNGKTRPVLILEQQKDVIFVFNVTTQYGNKNEAIRSKYFKINDWRKAGLRKQSYVDTNNVRNLPPIALIGKPPIGKLSEADMQRLIEFLSK